MVDWYGPVKAAVFEEKAVPVPTFTTRPVWTGLASNLGLCVKRQATKQPQPLNSTLIATQHRNLLTWKVLEMSREVKNIEHVSPRTVVTGLWTGVNGRERSSQYSRVDNTKRYVVQSGEKFVNVAVQSARKAETATPDFVKQRRYSHARLGFIPRWARVSRDAILS